MNRTKRAAAAALLGVFGLFAAGVAQAQAPYYYAKESFSSAPVSAGGKAYYTTSFPTTSFSSGTGTVTVRVPQAILAGLAYFARVEMTNMRVAVGNMDMQIADGGACSSYTARGITYSTAADSGTVAVYSIPSAVVAPANSCLRIGLNKSGMTINGTGGNMSLIVKLYDTLAGAIRANDANLLGSSTTGNVAFVHSVVTAKITPMDAHTASVERGFAAFTGSSPNVANLATVRLMTTHQIHGVITSATAPTAAQTSYRDANAALGAPLTADSGGTAGTAAGLVGSSTIYIKSDRGEFATGTYTLAGCPNKGVLTKVATGERAGQLMGTVARTGPETVSSSMSGTGPNTKHTYVRTGDGTSACTLTLNVTANAAEEAKNPPGTFAAIKAQKFTADLIVNPGRATLATTLHPDNLTGQAAGEIKRDGTTVHLPFLTTRAGYEHSLLLVNRGSKDADFWIESVSSSDGTGPSSKVSSASPMTVEAKNQKIVMAGDLVNLGENGTVGAATLSINSARGNVSVSSILKNLASNSTDTLSLVNPIVVAAVAAPPPTTAPTPPPTTQPDPGTTPGGGGGTPTPPPTSGQSNCGQLVPGAGRSPDTTAQRGSYSCTASDCCDVNQTAGGGRCDDASRPNCP